MKMINEKGKLGEDDDDYRDQHHRIGDVLLRLDL